MLRRLQAALLLTLAACRPAPAQLSAEHARALVDSVAAAFADYAARLNARDVDSAARFYSSDESFVWVEDGQVRYRSRADIRTALQPLTTYKSVRIDMDQPLIVALGPGAA